MAHSVVVAVGEAGDRLVDLVAERARGIRVGAGADSNTDMGPLITAAARDRIAGIIDRVVGEGCHLVLDGRTSAGKQGSEGYFLGPTLVDRVPRSAEVYREEVFGPVLSVMRTETLDEAIGVVNANEYGNGATIFTSSGAAARHFQRRVTAGMVGINVPIPVPASAYSFGGHKASMFGEHKAYGQAGVDFYTQEKTVTQRWTAGKGAPSYAFPGNE